MKTLTLDASLWQTRNDAHTELARLLDFPDYYGKNLDALFDCLTTLPEPVFLTLYGCAKMELQLGLYGLRLERVLLEAAREHSDFTVQLEK